MKVKVTRSGEKGFKEEKIKMFLPLTKEEQLKEVFNRLLNNLILEAGIGKDEGKLIEKYTDIFMREIKIKFYWKDQ